MSLKCIEPELGLACFTDAAGARQTVFAHQLYDADGAPYAIYFTDAADTIIDVNVGSVAPGACPVTPPDVEWEPLCDVQPDGSVVQFIRRSITAFDASANPIDPVRVDDFLPDKVTPYVVTGTVGDCDSCVAVAPLGLITSIAPLRA